MNIFNLENQYKKYLERVRINESDMNSIQKKETKRAFFGACGQMFVLLREDISELPENIAIGVLESLDKQVNDFWVNEAISKN